MHFSHYLRRCREKLGMTQEELVVELYRYDDSEFDGVDGGTLSKWEREIITPRVSRQLALLRFFQERIGAALPCWEGMDTETSERLICRRGIKNLLGKSRRLVLNFPEASLPLEEVTVHQLRNATEMERFIEVARGLDRDFTQEYSGLNGAHYRRWALHPGSAFYVAEYKGQFLGLLFALRVRAGVFDALMRFEREERDLEESDLVMTEEPGCSYLLNFFALNEEIASLLFLRYYAHLIAHQRLIREVGLSVAMEDALKLIREMRLEFCREKRVSPTLTLRSYRNSLKEFFASPKVMRLLFSTPELPKS